jgi:hypothetical protein
LDLLNNLFYQGQGGELSDLCNKVQPLIEESGTPRQRILFYHRLAMKDFLEHRHRVSTETMARLRTTFREVLDTNDRYLVAMWQFGLGSCLL